MKKQLSVLVFCLLSSWLWAQEPVSKGFFTGVAIGGMDTVAYHTPGQTEAVAGRKDFEYEWLGATWRFADVQSRDKFAANPEQYRPEFNGHCANALSLGEGLVKTDGKVWQFFDDKLYLFYAEAGLERWQNGDFRAYRARAEQAWQDILAKP